MSQVRGNEPEHGHEHGHGPLLFITSTSSRWLVPAAISINVTKSIANYLSILNRTAPIGTSCVTIIRTKSGLQNIW